MQTEDVDLRLLEFVADIVIELNYRIGVAGIMGRFINAKNLGEDQYL